MLATIETIKEVKNHPNADRLDIVTVNGFSFKVMNMEYDSHK